MTDDIKRVQAEALTDEQIGAWCAEAQGKTFGVIPQARYVIAKALASLPEAPAVPVVAWQWNSIGTWHTMEIGEVEDAEQYARSMAGEFGKVRAIYATPPAKG